VIDDRQSDYAIEKCVGIGGIACAARAILPNNCGYRLRTKINEHFDRPNYKYEPEI